MTQDVKYRFTRVIIRLFLSVVLAAFFGFGLPQIVHGQAAQEPQHAPRSFFSVALDKISGAVSNFRDALTRRSIVPNRAGEALTARKAVLLSVLEYLLEETKQAQESLGNLSVDQEKKDEIAKILEENIFWFTSMSESIVDARAVSQLQTVSNDISQYRDQRHAILIRKISELAVAERQKALVEVAQVRAEQIERDLAALEEEGEDAAGLRESLAVANGKIAESSDLVSEAISILSDIHSPYEEKKYRGAIEEAHQILSRSSALLREAYKIFIAMADAVK